MILYQFCEAQTSPAPLQENGGARVGPEKICRGGGVVGTRRGPASMHGEASSHPARVRVAAGQRAHKAGSNPARPLQNISCEISKGESE